jgi:hypothetical protein
VYVFGSGFRDRVNLSAYVAATLLQADTFWLIMCAYGLRLSFSIGALVFMIVQLGTAIPNAPANIGSYQFFTVVGLTLFGIGKTQAAGFSLVVFALLTAPIWALGLLALAKSGATLYSLRMEAAKLIKPGGPRSECS